LKRGKPLTANPARAAEKRARREARRAAEGPRPEDVVRELRVGSSDEAAARDDTTARRAWQAKVTARGCVMCAASPVDAATRAERWPDLSQIDAHHVISQDKLKRWGLHARLWDARNGIALCRLHHARHELAYQRVPRRLLPRAAWQFAAEIGAEFVLDDENVYPQQAS
jgi:hypothetical protein